MKALSVVILILGCHLSTSSSDSREKIPVTPVYTIQEINSLLNKIPQVGNNLLCIRSESCARDWMSYYNRVLDKISATSGILDVRNSK